MREPTLGEPRTKRTRMKSIEIFWARYGQRLLQIGIGLMIVAALWRLGLELPRLIGGEGEADAVDLISRHKEVGRWFTGLPVYGEMANGDYPPASHPMLWPWMGWLDRAATRWFWAVTTLLMLGWLGWLGLRESSATTRWEKAFFLLMPFALYPASAGVRVGQLATHLMPPLVVGMLMMTRSFPNGAVRSRIPKQQGLTQDLLAAALVVFALVKPTVSAPFFWLVCFMPGRWRPVLLVSFGYAALALFATLFQDGNLLSLHMDWLSHAGTQLGTRGHASLHTWLEAIDRSDWMLSASLLLFGVMGLWAAIYRRARPWALLSVAAMVARFWVDHQVFDDVLLWIPLIALFRLTKLESVRWVRLAAAVLFALNWFALMAPARFLSNDHPVSGVAIPIQTAIWMAVLVFFMMLAHRDTFEEPHVDNGTIIAKDSV
ncbi:MAG: hypothetical protein AAF716_13545 [Cyanobacteria bacterium P01_D01_bin.1]